jgi:AraC-like DNA-binding protein
MGDSADLQRPARPATAWVADGFPGQRMVVLPRPVIAAALRKPATAELLVTDVGMFPSAARHLIQRPGGVPAAILIYCVRGTGWADIGGVRQAVPPDHVLLVPPGTAHAYGAAEHRPWTIYWCHVAGRQAAVLQSLLQGGSDRRILHATDARHVVPLFERILSLLEGGYGQDRLTVASLTMGYLFGTMLADRGGLGPPGSPAAAAADDLEHRLEDTVQFMRENVGGHVTVAELAAMAGLAPSHYAAVFKRKTGYAVIDYFLRLKMQEASRLLDATTAPIKQIAGELGYDDPLYFSRAFRKITAVSPREYRAHRKG